MTNHMKFLIPLALLLPGACAAQEAKSTLLPEATTSTTEGFECTYEDMLAFELKDPAYDLPAGYTICVHIDEANDLPTPEEVRQEG